MEITLLVEDARERSALFGPAEKNLKTLRDLLGVKIFSRDSTLKISGSNETVQRAAGVMHQLQQLLKQSNYLTHDQVLAVIAEAAHESASTPQHVAVYGSSRPVQPKTPGQKTYLEAIAACDLTICLGPAGTGKTYLATAMAVSLLRAGKIKRIVLVRPAVEAGEKLGYLPGDMIAKVNPFLRPLLDALHDMMEFDQLKRFLANDVIEILPLAFMRGRTLNDAAIILDEAQNTTRGQMLMFLTRLGNGSKMIVTGDNTQSDLPNREDSGLIDAVRRLGRVEGVSVVMLTTQDIVRHPLVQRVVDAYAEDGIMPKG